MGKVYTGVVTMVLLLIAIPGWGQRFAAIGDFGRVGQPEQDVATLVLGWNPEFIISLGDNNYEYGQASTMDQNVGQYYHSYIYPYTGAYGATSDPQQNRFFPCLGNHDVMTLKGQPYLDFFTLPGNERYYDFVRGNVHFFVLNSNASEPDGITSTSVQAQWLQQQLAAATEPWKIVYQHHSPYSSGDRGNDKKLRWPFRQWGASLVMAGHDHHYERLLVDSLTYIVNGVGGDDVIGVKKLQPYTRALYALDYGAMLFNATPQSLSMQFYTRTGELVDAYTLQKEDPLPISLTSFVAKRQGTEVVLRWTTATEQNSRGFGIEGSPDGLSYHTVGFVPSQPGSSTSTRSYRWTNNTPGKVGWYYYRLRQEDEGGQFAYYGPIAVHFQGLPAALNVYPNPFDQELTMEITSVAVGLAMLTLTDEVGKVVWHEVQTVVAGVNRLGITPPLKAGQYQATVRMNGHILRQLVVKQ
ncbi:metallophosphoesterase [Hymenobacter sp. BT730]|uniref:metallophosphoesterase n=1 Tax=Hymenobacter sp. BT730 TaxID=3063332 RepID=UPI0026E05833|nr:metallophosphoesterase [Hymenobacter sp. BT730]